MTGNDKKKRVDEEDVEEEDLNLSLLDLGSKAIPGVIHFVF